MNIFEVLNLLRIFIQNKPFYIKLRMFFLIIKHFLLISKSKSILIKLRENFHKKISAGFSNIY